MEPLISIIVPTYNRSSLIPETIFSVSKQTYNNWELLIIDDGSTDNTEDAVKPFLVDDRIKFFRRPDHLKKGGNSARNYGYEISNGIYVKWLDSDDLLQQQCLHKQVELLIRENCDVVFCRSQYFEISNQTGENILGQYWHEKFSTGGNILENFITGKIRFSNNDGLWKRSAFKTNRPYNEVLKNSQEYLMIASTLASGCTATLLDEVLVLIRKHDQRMGSSRSYASFAHHQRLARFLIIKELKKYMIKDPQIFNYLKKSILYYLLMQLKKGQFRNSASGIKISLKAFLE